MRRSQSRNTIPFRRCIYTLMHLSCLSGLGISMAKSDLSRCNFILLIIFLFLACAMPGHGAQSTPTRPVRVMMDNNYPSIAFLDNNGKPQGILVDQWRLREQKSGARVELLAMNWSEALRRMEEGDSGLGTAALLKYFAYIAGGVGL